MMQTSENWRRSHAMTRRKRVALRTGWKLGLGWFRNAKPEGGVRPPAIVVVDVLPALRNNSIRKWNQ